MCNNAKISNLLHKYAKIHFLVQTITYDAIKKLFIFAKTQNEKMSKVKINRKRHILKAITWNLLAMTTTFVVLSYLPPYFGFEPIDKSSVGWLVILDRVAKLIFYYLHERAWFSSNLGVVKTTKA